MDLRYYVYMLKRPDGSPFYVGMGKNDRVDQHEVNARQGEKSHRANVIRAIWAAGGAVLKELVQQSLTAADAKALERQLIASIGRRDLNTGPLVNRTDGGEGVTGLSPEQRAAHSRATRAGMDRPEVRQKCADNINRLRSNPELADKFHSRNYWSTPEARAKQSVRVKAELSDPKVRQDRADRIRKAHGTPEAKLKLSAAARGRMDKPGRRESHSEMMRQLWKTPGFAEKRRATFAAKRLAKQEAVLGPR